MQTITYSWRSTHADHAIELVHVPGTDGRPFLFGEGTNQRAVDLQDFFITTVPVTQPLWAQVTGANPSLRRGARRPVENVSWDEITERAGFLDRINTSGVREVLARQVPLRAHAVLRLPSETEWEYAARGGPHWRDAFRFSGSDDVDAVAWYKDNSGDETHDVGLKAANQLGVHDMSGNVWEWCQDGCTREIGNIPNDGRAFDGPSDERVLRGGCYHNWAIHCTVSKRYEIAHEYRDGCIGFRLVLS